MMLNRCSLWTLLTALAVPASALTAQACPAHGDDAKASAAACCLVAPASQVAEDAAPQAKFQRDRQAILSMAGQYRVRFQFIETVPLEPGYEPKPPYLEGATEFVEVVEDAGDRIVLQHILVVPDEDAPEGVRVVKHWRQDWEYENQVLYEYQGQRTWAPRRLTEQEARGAWTQRVFQVDDSPRYQGFGRWVHQGNLSYWQSNPTWRPLPRREHTKRSDYDVLAAVNRHTITPTGWVHEEDNYKLVLPSADGSTPLRVLVREAGLNVYERLADGEVDFSAGHAYWEQTKAFWADVRAAWGEIFAVGQPITLAREVDDQPLWKHMAQQAQAARDGSIGDAQARRAAIRAILDRFLVSSAEPVARSTAAR